MMRSGSTLLSSASVQALTAEISMKGWLRVKEGLMSVWDTDMFGKSHDCLSMEEINCLPEGSSEIEFQTGVSN